MKIYTKTGDHGDTTLFGGKKVSKAHLRVEAYGSLDELNAVLGIVQNKPTPDAVSGLLTQVQSQLFNLGAELASPDKDPNGVTLIGNTEIEALERAIDSMEQSLRPLTTFILPGGSEAASFLHLARTICRRAERRIVELSQQEAIRVDAITYVNRLSDFLFVAARFANHQVSVADVLWVKG